MFVKDVSLPKKPSTTLNRPAEGKSFVDTVRLVRFPAISINYIGTNVTMRQTRDESLLVEFAKGQKSPTAAKIIASDISSKLGNQIGEVNT